MFAVVLSLSFYDSGLLREREVKYQGGQNSEGNHSLSRCAGAAYFYKLPLGR